MNKISPITTIRGHSFYTVLVNRDSIIVDLGAHKGEFSAEMGRRFGCKCYAVEALPTLFERIDETLLLHKFNYAMSECDGPVELYVSQNLEGNSIKALSDGGGSVTVDGLTLESLMEKVGINTIELLKMDVEGAEIGIFEASSDATLERISQITVEFHDFLPDVVSVQQVERIKERLLELDFYMIKFSRALNTDVLFINKKRSRISTAEYWYIKFVLKYFRGIARILQKILSEKSSSLPLRT